MKKKAVILMSGGLDSTTVLAQAIKEGYQCYGLSFDYGQKHLFELQAAKKIAKYYQLIEHKIAKIDLRVFGHSSLTDNIKVPKGRNVNDVKKDDIPITYVPARNTIFLSFALAYAEVKSCYDIFLGVNAVDYSGYPDCRPEYIHAFEKMANLATRSGIKGNKVFLKTPLIDLSKADIIRMGLRLGVDYSMTHSCYDPSDKGLPCKECDACQLRDRGFAEVERHL